MFDSLHMLYALAANLYILCQETCNPQLRLQVWNSSPGDWSETQDFQLESRFSSRVQTGLQTTCLQLHVQFVSVELGAGYI